MCPYARFQSSMFDKDTLIITYDRSVANRALLSPNRNSRPATASCIDCSLCVQVCPTGIDIRNGLQYECIGCASCVDACNSVMDKIGQPRGLVRYTTEHGLVKQVHSGPDP
jgi:polyferredoxin